MSSGHNLYPWRKRQSEPLRSHALFGLLDCPNWTAQCMLLLHFRTFRGWTACNLDGTFLTDSNRFGAVIDQGFLKPRMLKCLLGRDPALWVVDEDLP